MTPPTPSKIIRLSDARIQQVKAALTQLQQFIPEIDRMKDCDAECQEIADTAAHLQMVLSKYLHNFGGTS